jgi:hypothetical protein
MITERDKRRLDALIAIVKPANSLAARLDTLTDNERDWYNGWKAYCDRYIQRHSDGDAYAKHLDGYGPFGGLRDDIKIALFGETPHIIVSDDIDTAAQRYWRYCNG